MGKTTQVNLSTAIIIKPLITILYLKLQYNSSMMPRLKSCCFWQEVVQPIRILCLCRENIFTIVVGHVGMCRSSGLLALL